MAHESAESARIWSEHQIDPAYTDEKRFVHPESSELTLYCRTLLDPDRKHSLLPPGTESHDKLQILAVLGPQRLEVTAACRGPGTDQQATGRSL